MSFNIEGMLAAFRTSETEASSAINALNGDSEGWQLAAAGHIASTFTIFANLASNVIKTVADSKTTVARALARG